MRSKRWWVFWALRNLGNRRGDVGVHLLAGHDAHPGQEHPRDADHAVLALALFLVLARDHFVAPGHRLADVAEADLREFAQDLLNLDLGALGPAAQDFRTSCRDLSILP